MSGRRRSRTVRRGALAAWLALALAAAPAGAQDGEDGPGDGAVADPSVAATGFLVADGTYAPLPEDGPAPRPRPLDPEDRPEVEVADAEADALPDDALPDDALPDAGPAPARSPEIALEDVERDGEPTIVRPTPPTAADPADGADASDLPPVRVRLRETDAEFAQCTAALEGLGTAFEPIDPIRHPDDGDCGIERPVLVSEIVPGIALQPDARMRCATARALAEWVAGDVVPAAEALDARVTTVDHGSTYICRRRNNRPAGKLSEHSFGNAVDVMGFRFAERDAVRIEPREPGGPVAAFQRTVREASCGHFTTVIGPGTDAAHADHLHLDVKERRGGYRLCQ